MKKIFSMLMLSLVLSAAPALASASIPASAEQTPADLEKDHVEFVIAHHLDVIIDLAHADREVVTTAQGVPVSLIFDLDGVSAFFVTQDGSTIHTLLKAHRAFLGLPEGVELAFSLSVGGSALVEFHRIYGILELGTIVSDVKTAVKDLESKEWRDTTEMLIKMLLCAQLDKLPTLKGVPAFVVTWVTSALKPSCSE